MKICGFNNTCDTGPDKFGCSIFVGGCNLRCPYCMNSSLVTGEAEEKYTMDEILNLVRKSESEWVFISGGEPTYSDPEALSDLVFDLWKMGKKIGISTNGTNPEAIRTLIDDIDYVSLDLKGDVKVYNCISNGSEDFMSIISTWKFLRDGKRSGQIDYEIRTTVFPYLIDKTTIDFMSQFFLPKEKWVFQVYRPTNDMLDKSLVVNDTIDYEDYAKEFSNYAKIQSDADVSIRHV